MDLSGKIVIVLFNKSEKNIFGNFLNYMVVYICRLQHIAYLGY